MCARVVEHMTVKQRMPSVESPEQILAAAEAWLQRQRAVLAERHRSAWPQHRVWIEENLLEEVRQRLLARGWRPRP